MSPEMERHGAGDPRIPMPGRASSLPRVNVRYGRPGRDYGPGDAVSIEYECQAMGDDSVRAVERSVLWYTEGKGEEDIGVHYFDRHAAPADLAVVLPEGRFEVTLPPTPLSYEGVIVKIRWCARIRLFFDSGRDHVSEHVFTVGRVPPSVIP